MSSLGRPGIFSGTELSLLLDFIVLHSGADSWIALRSVRFRTSSTSAPQGEKSTASSAFEELELEMMSHWNWVQCELAIEELTPLQT